MERQSKLPSVNLTTRRPFASSLMSKLKDTFFPDDPFRHFSGQSPSRRAWSIVAYFVPILEWGSRYNLSLFASDLLAGITIASLAIPQGISYAKLADIPPIIGLYSSFAPPLVYAVFGSSNNVAVGTIAAVSLLLASTIRDAVSPAADSKMYVYTVFTATFIAGVFQLALGIFRATITGFMGGTAVIIILQQLKGLLGMQHFTTKTDVVSVMRTFFSYRDEFTYRMVFSFALQEGIAAGRSLALLKNEKTDGSKEMIAFGLMNIVGSLTSCYLTSGSFSRSAVNYNAGCKTPMCNVVMALCMLLVLLLLAPLFKHTPLVALAAIITAAMLGLVDVQEVRRLFKMDKFDFCVCMAAFLGVAFVNMEMGLLLSVGLSVIRALLHVARPVTHKLGNVAGTELYRDVEQYPDSTTIPGVLILQLGSPIYFANAGYLKERIIRWVEEEENCTKDKDHDLQLILFEMSGVAAIDNSGMGMLFEVALINPGLTVAEKMVASDFVDEIGKEWIFLSIGEALLGSHFALEKDKNHEEQV
ncbi:hypothetical protein HPP92_005544 [Vanilla planifolia]|uniref:STAS domain-containing protein n=1 Tax=Vanilla planifolia TaxID=51239 RepID=A0A835VDA1_VANPL|nr:hypothetical protein HPP92_005544 [Vanilla planifolia]